MGEFEFALVFYHRGQKLRPQIQEFRLGIQKSQEAIETSVGGTYKVLSIYLLSISKYRPCVSGLVFCFCFLLYRPVVY